MEKFYLDLLFHQPFSFVFNRLSFRTNIIYRSGQFRAMVRLNDGAGLGVRAEVVVRICARIRDRAKSGFKIRGTATVRLGLGLNYHS